MQHKKTLLASLAAAFMIAGCGEDTAQDTASMQNEESKTLKSGFVTDSKSCDALFRNEVTAEGRQPDVQDYYILSRTPDGKKVKEACRFVDSGEKDEAPAYELYKLNTNSFCTGTTESRYPYTCYYNKGITEERDAKRQAAKNALRP